MEAHILAVGYSLIAMIIGLIIKKIHGIHNAKIERSKSIVSDIQQGIRKSIPDEILQSNYVFFNTFLASMRHGYIVSLILKLSISVMAITLIFLTYFINSSYVYPSIVVVIVLFSWLFYTDWMYSEEISSYEKALLKALADFAKI